MHVVESAQQWAVPVSGRTATELMRGGRRLHAHVTGLKGGEEEPRAQAPIDVLVTLRDQVSLADRVPQRRAGRAQASVGDSELVHADRIIGELPAPGRAASRGLPSDVVEGTPGDAERDGGEQRNEHRMQGQPPQHPLRPRLIIECAAMVVVDRYRRRRDVVTSGATQPGCVPGLLDGPDQRG